MAKNSPCNRVLRPSQWWVYMLRCADDSLYTGVTTDVMRRWREHDEGPEGARYTRARRPVTVVLCVAVPDRATACRLEARFKRLPRARKERLIQALFGPTVANDAETCLTACYPDAEMMQ